MPNMPDEIRANLDAALQHLMDKVHLPALDEAAPIPKESKAHHRFHTAEHYLNKLPKEFLSLSKIEEMRNLWDAKRFQPVLALIQELRLRAKLL
ncbi:hypothetical protein HLH26_08555 [Gluconacetobacter sp. 1b LMG 1731]|uniref:Uncharacterized protein n=1 Tax=Gluconacetobacter dulcium TaxID=2729096 RepID=A0A7W4NSF5_9PROT|nr:hypothetical protein [Gluconacetobacter dulcium]MBB2164591.1 hypothetical protein [Gluconacetobacter dulcium]MBB2193642.1 hypothetical protein [Gluconacetobacter dulcium]